MRKITLIFRLFLVVCGLFIGNINVWAASVQHFGGDEQLSWTTSPSTTGILPGSTVTLKGLVMTFGGSTKGTYDDQWDWDTKKKNGILSKMPNAGSSSTGVTSVAIGDIVPEFGGTYKFEPSTTGVLSIGVKGGGEGNTTADGKLYLVTVDKDNIITEIVSSKGGYDDEITETYHLIAGNTYYFFQCATKSDRVEGYRLKLQRISYQTSVPVTVTAAGYATFSSPYPLDLSGISGGTAYIIADKVNAGSLALTEQTTAVPANTGLIIKCDGGGTVTIPVDVSAVAPVAPSVNYLHATDGSSVAEGNYVFAYEDDTFANPGFYRLPSATVIAAGKAYLSADAFVTGVKSMFLPFDGTATGVETVQGEGFMVNDEYYNLNGQQVTKDYKGIVIVNGKKFYNK